MRLNLNMLFGPRTTRPVTHGPTKATAPGANVAPTRQPSRREGDRLTLSAQAKDATVRVGVNRSLFGTKQDKFETFSRYQRPPIREKATGAALAQVDRTLESGRKAEKEALLRQNEDTVAKYDRLSAFCDSARDPEARLALMVLLLRRDLLRQDARGEGTMLDHLDRLTTLPLAPGVNRADLITNLLKEMNHPLSINQQYKGTCVATAATMYLVQKNPAEYARLLSGLAGPAGRVTTKDGTVLQREPDWNDANDGNRTPSVRLLQPALMELGNFELDYANRLDMHLNGWGVSEGRGLTHHGSLRVLQALTGERFEHWGSIDRSNVEQAWQSIERSLKAGNNNIPIAMYWEGGGAHMMLINTVYDGVVTLTNPWGEWDTISMAELKERLIFADVPTLSYI